MPGHGKDREAWVERADPLSGQAFYYNLDTLESTYAVPPRVLHADWEVMKDPISDRIFFYNKMLGTSQWERPQEAFVTPEQAGQQQHWNEVWDEELQRRFWYNPATGESTWVRPPGPGGVDGRQRIASVSTVPGGPAEGDWRVMKDDLTERVFYYNVETGVSQWERPLQFSQADTMSIRSTMDPRLVWEKLRDPQTGRVFFYNKEEGTTQWERPPELGTEPLTPRSSVAAPPTEDWEEIFDPLSGQPFYFNKSDGTSQWEPPVGFKTNHEPSKDVPEGAAPVVMAPTPQHANDGEVPVKSPPSEDAAVEAASVPAGTAASEAAESEGGTRSEAAESESRSVARADSEAARSVPAASESDEVRAAEAAEEATEAPATNPGRDSPTAVTSGEGLHVLEGSSPDALGVPPPEPAPADADGASENGSEADSLCDTDWEKLQDSNTGRTYFFNAETGASQWVHPLRTRDVGDDWCEMVDERTKRAYFYNRTTGESRWRIAKSSDDAAGAEAPTDDKLEDNAGADDKPSTAAGQRSLAASAASEGEAGSTAVSRNVSASINSGVWASSTSVTESAGAESSDARPSSATASPPTSPERKSSAVSPPTSPVAVEAVPKPRSSPIKVKEREQVAASDPPPAAVTTAATPSPTSADVDPPIEPTTWSYFSEKYRDLVQRTSRKGADPVEPSTSGAPPVPAPAPAPSNSAEPTATTAVAAEPAPQAKSDASNSTPSPAHPPPAQQETAQEQSNLGATAAAAEQDEAIEFVAPPRHPPPVETPRIDIPDEFHPDRVFSSASAMPSTASSTTSSYRDVAGAGLVSPPGPHAPHHPGGPIERRPRTGSPGGLSGISSHTGYVGGSVRLSATPSGWSPGSTAGSVFEPAPLAGLLEKRARHGRQTWQQRWFVLGKRNLQYFESEQQARGPGVEEAATPLAKIDLAQIKSIEPMEGLEFSLRGNGAIGVLCVLRAQSSQERDLWMERLAAGAGAARADRERGRNSKGRAQRRVSDFRYKSNGSTSLQLESPGLGNETIARCVTSVTGSEPGQLSFSRGDLVRVLRQGTENEYWVGECNGRIGNFAPGDVVVLSPRQARDALRSKRERSWTETASEVVNGRGDSIWSAREGDEDDAQSLPLASRHLSERMSGVEKRIEHRRKLERLEALVDALNIEPMKRLETYPTEAVLEAQREELRQLNVRNHKLKAEVRGLEWKLYNQLDEEAAVKGFADQVDGMEGPHAYLLVSYSRMLAILQREPYLLVQIGANLKIEAQYLLASTLANALFDQYSVQEEAFVSVVQAAIEMLWDQGLPSFELMRRQHQDEDVSGAVNPSTSSILKGGSSDKQPQQPLLPALLVAFVQRDECRHYLDKVLASIKAEFCALLLSVGNSSVKVEELSCLLLDAVASDAGLDQVPRSVCEIGALLHEVGGLATLHRFLFDVLLVPALFDPRFLPGEEELTDPVLVRRVSGRMEQLTEFLCVDIAQVASAGSAAKPGSASQRMLLRLVSKLTSKITSEGQRDRAASSSKPRQLCDLVVLSCFELYMLHLSVASYARRYRNKSLPSELLSALGDLGEPQPLPEQPNRNPFLVLRLPGPISGEEHRPMGLDQDMLNTLIRARSKLDSVHESWNPARDGAVLEQLERDFEKANLSMSEQRRLRMGFERAQQYFGELALQKERLLNKMQVVALSPRRTSPRRWSAMPVVRAHGDFGGQPAVHTGDSGLVASVPVPRHTPIAVARRRLAQEALGEDKGMELHVPNLTASPLQPANGHDHGQARGVVHSEMAAQLASTTSAVATAATLVHEAPHANGDSTADSSEEDDNNPLATLLATVFSPLKLPATEDEGWQQQHVA